MALLEGVIVCQHLLQPLHDCMCWKSGLRRPVPLHTHSNFWDISDHKFEKRDQMSVPGVSVVPSMIVRVTSDECRSTKPLSSVWGHYTATKSEANKKLACCNYCRKELYPHCDRMKRHLQICPALGNECKNQNIARNDYLADVMGASVIVDKVISKKKPNHNALSHESLQLKREDDEQDEDYEGEDNGDGSKLINQFLKSKKLVTETTTLAKKPVRKFTDQDFDRETKELTVKKLRLDVKLKEEQSKLCQQLSKGLVKILKAVDVFLDTQPRVTVYTGTQDGDPSSILHTAYETTVNETPVTAEHHTEITIQQQEHKN